MPVPGEAPCAEASITAPTEDSTEALHTADAEVPEGMLNDSVVVSTTVVAGMEDNARLVMVSHPVADSAFQAALAQLAGLDSLRSQPRAIRVIEEDFSA
jgi:homoserine dehydrogenase